MHMVSQHYYHSKNRTSLLRVTL